MRSVRSDRSDESGGSPVRSKESLRRRVCSGAFGESVRPSFASRSFTKKSTGWPSTGRFTGFSKDQCLPHFAPSAIQRFSVAICSVPSFGLCDFGGGMSSILFRDIRETQKLTYNINAFQSSQKAVGEFGISTQTKEVDKMLNAVFQHIEDLRTKDPDAAYVQSALDNMALSFPLQIETASQIAGKVATMLTYNLPDTYYNTYIDDVRKVKVEDIKATAAKHIHPIPVIVIVGKAKKIREQLANVPYLKDAKIVEYDTDLNKK